MDSNFCQRSSYGWHQTIDRKSAPTMTRSGNASGKFLSSRPSPKRIAIPVSRQSSAIPSNPGGILAWAVDGCLLWQQEGLGIPKHVEDTTDAYRKEMDPMPDFIEACLVNDDKGRVLNAAMWECYQNWSRKNRDRPKLGQKTFTQRLEQAGVDRSKRRIFLG